MSSLSMPLLLVRRMLMPSICYANTPLTPNRHKSTRTAERENAQMFRQERAAKRKGKWRPSPALRLVLTVC